LYAESAPGVFPFNGAIDTGDHTGATFQTTGKLDHHLSLLVKRIEVCRAGIDTETFFTVMTDFLVERDMGLPVIFKGIKSQLLSDLH
jgi:hypothetical protein